MNRARGRGFKSNCAVVCSSEGASASIDAKTLTDVNMGVNDMMLWEVAQVCKWLETIGMGQYQDNFAKNNIKGEHLPLLTDDYLKEVWIIACSLRVYNKYALQYP